MLYPNLQDYSDGQVVSHHIQNAYAEKVMYSGVNALPVIPALLHLYVEEEQPVRNKFQKPKHSKVNIGCVITVQSHIRIAKASRVQLASLVIIIANQGLAWVPFSP